MIVTEVMRAVESLPPGPLFLYGHCFGALLAAIAGARLSPDGPQRLCGVLLSGISQPGAPSLSNGFYIHQLERTALFDYFTSIGKIPAGFDRESGYASVMERMLRADFAAIETWQLRLSPLDVPVILLRGAGDAQLSHADKQEWVNAVGPGFRTCEVNQESIDTDSLSVTVFSEVNRFVQERLSMLDEG
jgi:surfactin synthase thioesterase subunit